LTYEVLIYEVHGEKHFVPLEVTCVSASESGAVSVTQNLASGARNWGTPTHNSCPWQ